MEGGSHEAPPSIVEPNSETVEKGHYIMKCLNCGKDSEHFLCEECVTPEVLDKLFNEIRSYNPETCPNPYLVEYASRLTEKYAERDIIPDILALFDPAVSEYYYCRYFRMRRDSRFEEAALSYLQKHDINSVRSQAVLYDLLDNYIPNDFIKPQKWCKAIGETGGLCCELYAVAAKYYAMIGEYDAADDMTGKGLKRLEEAGSEALLFYSPDNMISRLGKQKEDTYRYRTKKPYWPTTEERRRAVAMFYDERGIKYPRIENRPQKVAENAFAPLKECFEDELQEYCTFWCSEAFSVSGVKSIYQIAAVKISASTITDTFEAFVRPWDANSQARKAAAKEVGVPLEMIESAEDVDIVMPKFFDFVGDHVLVSTGALGNQGILISRAARYAGMTGIKNEFYDLLDLAADTSSDFDLSNNTREYLLSAFSITEGKTALEKAMVNKTIYDILLNYGK